MVYVDSFVPSQKEWERFMDKVDVNSHFQKPVDIWLDVDRVVSSIDYEEVYTFVTITNGEFGEVKKFFVRSWVINPNHSNPLTRHYIDDLYSYDTLKSTSRKDRTNILKFIQQSM